MFDSLSERLRKTLSDLTGRGRVSEADVDAAMREIRLSLLEADVNFKVVKDFVARVRERALGSDVAKSLTPGQQVVKIVHEELTALMGAGSSQLAFSPRPPTTILLAGLQGSGKTTAAGKLALLLQQDGRKPALVAADLQRPAAGGGRCHRPRELVELLVHDRPPDPLRRLSRSESGRERLLEAAGLQQTGGGLVGGPGDLLAGVGAHEVGAVHGELGGGRPDEQHLGAPPAGEGGFA